MALELVAEAAFSVTLGQLFKDLISPLIKRLTFGGEIRQLLDNIRRGLLTVKAVLDEAEEKQIISPSVTNWVNELKDAAYQVEDLLDETETKNLKLELSQATSTEKSEIEKLKEKLKEDLNFRKEKLLKEIDEKLKNFAGARDLLNLKASVRQKPPTMYPTTSLPDESEVIGRDEDIKILKESLLAGNAQQNKIPVIAIVGLGGVGKTRLAQHFYKEVEVEKEKGFDLMAWAYVSEGSDIVEVTITILQSFILDKCDVRDLNILQLRLEGILKGKKFLLVLDNIWDDDYLNCWDLLSRPLRAGKCGSRIIVTTRNQNVASKMGADVTYPLWPLSDEACWSLFEKHAFQGVPKDYQRLKAIGEKIVKKCNGLPLAAKTLGGILRPKLEEEEWCKILDSKIWDLADSNILPALTLSYYDLPGYLKKCFTYCSIFPKGYEIEKEKLVLLWMAQGFLQQPNSNNTMEKVGEEYCRELISRSLFQSSGNGLSIVMHDLINDLAQFASGEFCCNFENGKTHANWEKARHFAFLMDRFDGPDKFVEITTTSSLRTFFPVCFSNPSPRFYLNTMDKGALLEKMKRLRVLSFSCYVIYYLPESLGELIHLRYLDSSHTLIEKVPDSACSLYNLQTLLLSSCPHLTALPADIGNLTNLRHLDVSETKLSEMPLGFKRLKSLQVLNNFVVSKDGGSKMGELYELSHLRMLSISGMEKVVDAENASTANLGGKRHLKELGFKWSSNTDVPNVEGVFKNLQPHKNLKKLTIENYVGNTFPNWLGDADFSNMVSLTLRNCNNCASLPSLGKLSSLQELYITKMDRLEKLEMEFYGNNDFESKPFRSLKTLWLEDLQKWTIWGPYQIEGEAFPSLQELHIQICPQIQSIPGDLHSLKKLKLSNCPKLSQFSECSLPPNLKSLIIANCDNLTPKKEWGLHQMKWLTDFEIEGGCGSMDLFPEEHLLPTSLTSLRIGKLPNLKFLGRGLHQLICLNNLEINDCEDLSMPSEKLPASLDSLRIQQCSKLAKDYKADNGWHNISHIANVDIPELTGFLQPGLP